MNALSKDPRLQRMHIIDQWDELTDVMQMNGVGRMEISKVRFNPRV